MKCPTCKNPVSIEHVNVQKDFAWCSHCGEAFGISSQLPENRSYERAEAVSAHFDLHNPPNGAWFSESRDQIKIGATTSSYMGIFLLIFAIFWWSILSTFFIADFDGPGDAFGVVFMIPFFIAGLVLMGLAIMMLVGKEEVIIKGNEGLIFQGVGTIGRRKHFRWSEIDNIREEAYIARNRNNEGTGYRLVLEGAKQVKFGSMWNSERRYYILNALKLAIKSKQR